MVHTQCICVVNYARPFTACHEIPSVATVIEGVYSAVLRVVHQNKNEALKLASQVLSTCKLQLIRI